MSVIVTDMNIVEYCNDCYLAAGYGCTATGEIMTTKDMKNKRSDRCPLKSIDGLLEALKEETALRCKDNVGGIFISEKDMGNIIKKYCEVE